MKKNILLVVVVIAIVGTIWYLESSKVNPLPPGDHPPIANPIALPGGQGTSTSTSVTLGAVAAADQKAGYQPAMELVDPTGFVNTAPFKLADLVGKKVILVDFWTYSCINCIRTLPHLTDWYKKYKDQGLAIVGVHTPEFDFEKDINNVKSAAQKYGIDYPVVLDSNYGTWQAYGNRYWPHEYLIDVAGYVVHDLIGEGDYDGTERAIQAALKQRALALGEKPVASPAIGGPSVDNIQASSPETYFGSNRNEYLGNGTPGKAGIQTFTEPVTANQNTLYLSGEWSIAPEYAETMGSDRIDYRYRARG